MEQLRLRSQLTLGSNGGGPEAGDSGIFEDMIAALAIAVPPSRAPADEVAWPHARRYDDRCCRIYRTFDACTLASLGDRDRTAGGTARSLSKRFQPPCGCADRSATASSTAGQLPSSKVAGYVFDAGMQRFQDRARQGCHAPRRRRASGQRSLVASRTPPVFRVSPAKRNCEQRPAASPLRQWRKRSRSRQSGRKGSHFFGQSAGSRCWRTSTWERSEVRSFARITAGSLASLARRRSHRGAS